MKLDDRFMAIMTIGVLLIGGGAVLQGGGTSIFGTSGAYEARPDAFTLRAGRVQALDVLLNDLNRERIDPELLQLVIPATCGSAMVVGGAIQYSESEACGGEVSFSYCVPYDDRCTNTMVSLTLLQNNDITRPTVAATNPDGSPVIVDVIQMGAAPQAPGAIVAARPARLSMPTDSEVITPNAATAEVRRIGEESGALVAAGGSDSNIRVSNTSARAGRVVTSGVTMASPDPVAESSGISIASGSTDTSPRGTAPVAPGGLAVAVLSAPRSGAPGFTPPERPGGAVTSRVASVAPSGMTAPDGGSASGVDVAAATSSTPDAPVSQTPAATVSTRQEVAIAPEAQTTEPRAVPIAEADPAPARIASLPSAPLTDRASPDVGEPSAAAAEVEVETADTARPSSPATPGGPASLDGQEQTQVARLSEADAPSRTASTPAQPTEVQRIARAPEAQVAQPDGPTTIAQAEEEDSGVLASLARSNTVLGATFSAAKALFGPSERAPAVAAAPAGQSAPRPAGSDEAPVIAMTPETQSGDVVVRGDAVVGTDVANRADTGPQVEVASLNTDQESYVPRTTPAESPLDAFMRESGAVLIEEPQESPAEAEPSLEVAALPSAGSETTDAVGGVRLALPQVAPANSAADLCDVRLGLQLQVGAELVATVYSGCRPETQLLVEHAGLAFTAETDIDGIANFVVPAMETNAEVNVTFADGGTATDRIVVEGMNRMTRVAVVWTDNIPFDLHAREFGADANSDGDVWSGNSRNYRLARRSGGGYHTDLGPQNGTGVRAEVYTLFESLRTDPGVVEFDLRLRGTAASCDNAPVIRVVRSEATTLILNRDLALESGVCDGATLADVGIGLQDIRIAKSQ